MDILRKKTMAYGDFQEYIAGLTAHKGFKGEGWTYGYSGKDQYGHELTAIESDREGKVIKVTVVDEQTNQECSINCSGGCLSVEGHDGNHKYGFGYDENKVLNWYSTDDGYKYSFVNYNEKGDETHKVTRLRDDEGNLISETSYFAGKSDGEWHKIVMEYANGKVASISDTRRESDGQMEMATLFISSKGESLLRLDHSEDGKLQKTTMSAVPVDIDKLKNYEWKLGSIQGGRVLWSATRDANDTFIFYDQNNIPTDIVAKDADGKKRRHSLKQTFASAKPQTAPISRGGNEG